MLRLKKLHIQRYKNIINQEFDFSENQGVIALVGENGSGKSNLLEAVSHIFNSVHNNTSLDFNYKFTYSLSDNEVKLNKTDDGLSISVNETTITVDVLRESFLPKKIIANYSGEDLRLFNECYKPSYDNFTRQLKSDREISILPMVYINKFYWDLCLLALYYTDHSVRTDIGDFCTNQLGIRNVIDITFEIDIDTAKTWKDNEPRQLLQAIFRIEDLSKIAEIDNANEKGIFFKEEKLKKTSATVTISLDELKKRFEEAEINIDEKDFFFYLYAAFSSKEYKLLKDIEFNLELTNGTVVGLNGFSEGEKKLILIEFVTKIISDENSLVLLDEPDAHTHISRKKELLKAIKSFGGQTILTTHFPIFVNEINKAITKSLYFIKDGELENGELIGKLVELSGGLLDYIEGSVIFASKNILALEGLSDIKCIRKAIEVFSIKDEKYKNLKEVQLVSFGGTGNATELFTEVLRHHMDHIEHLIYLFDNDDAGKKGHKKIEDLIDGEDAEFSEYKTKITPIYYKDGNSNYELEDCINPEAYRDIIENNKGRDTYRKFKGIKKTSDEIKERIKDKVDTFQPEWFDDFEPILDKLLQEFGLI